MSQIPWNRRYDDTESHIRGDAVNEILLRNRRASDREKAISTIRRLRELQINRDELEQQNLGLREAQRLLEGSLARYVSLFEQAPAGYLVLDEAGCVTEINLTGAAMLGVVRASLMGQPFVSCLANGDTFAFLNHLHQVFHAPGHAVAELRIQSRGADPVYVRIESVAVMGEPRACRSVMTNITEQRRTTQALDKIRSELDVLLGAIPAIVYFKDTHLRYVSVSKALADFLGRPVADMIGRTDFELFPRHMAEEIGRHSRTAMETGKALTGIEIQLVNADGQAVYLSSVLAPIVDAHGEIAGLVGAGMDITLLRDAANLNRELLLENRALTQSLFNAQENERRYLSRELHDELGQWLTAIQAEAVAIANSVVRDSDVHSAAEAISSSAQKIHEVIRSLLRQLRPATLDALGLADSLRELKMQWCSHNPEADLALEIEGDLGSLSEQVNITAYRVVQEALNNVSGHAGPTSRAIVRIRREAGLSPGMESLLLDVQDDGSGFDPSEAQNGMGLLGMRERVIAAGGIFALNSSPGKGTQIHVALPLKQPQERRRG